VGLAGGLEVDRQQGLHDLLTGLGRTPQGQVVDHRGDLDRHIVHVIAPDELPDALETSRRLPLAEHRLAQQIDVQGGAIGRQPGDLPAELPWPGVEDEMGDQVAHHGGRRGHRDLGGDGGQAATEGQHPTQGRGQEIRRILREAAQFDDGGLGILRTDHPIHEGHGEVQPPGILEQGSQHGRGLGHRALGSGPHPRPHLGTDLFRSDGGGWRTGGREGHICSCVQWSESSSMRFRPW
jgi:hypothetical protein